MVAKTIFLLFNVIFCGYAFSQCELTILDTTHVKCNGQNTGAFNLQTVTNQSFQIFLSNGVVQNNNLNFENLLADNYTAIIIDDLGCSDTSYIKIKEPSKLEVDLVCQNGKISASPFGGVQDYVYSWKSDLGVELSQESFIAFEPNVLFDFSLTDNNLCSVRDTVFVFADFFLDSLLGQLPFDVVTSNQSSLGQYSWNFGDLLSSNSTSPTYTFENVGEYEIELIVLNEFGCEDSKQIKVDVQGFDYELNDWEEFPNAFSPNDDGLNDYISFEDSHALADFNVTVFNRWGKPIVKWTDPNFKWFGNSKNGNKLAEGIYFYFLNAIGDNGKIYEKKGFFSLFM